MAYHLILIKHVLQSIPMYVHVAMEPHKQVLSAIEHSISKFLSGSYKRTDRRHWMSWEKVCRPTSANGLSIMWLNHLSMAFSGKLWWNFRTKNSIWVNFIRSKYGDPISLLAHPIFPRVSNSHTWHLIISVMDEVVPHIGICLRSGNSPCMWESWTHGRKLKHPALVYTTSSNLSIRDVTHQNSWNSPLSGLSLGLLLLI